MARNITNKLILKAGEPIGNKENTFPAIVKIGYPGGWLIPSVYADVIVSGESSFLNAGNIV
jgi:hypothetical protein